MILLPPRLRILETVMGKYCSANGCRRARRLDSRCLQHAAPHNNKKRKHLATKPKHPVSDGAVQLFASDNTRNLATLVMKLFNKNKDKWCLYTQKGGRLNLDRSFRNLPAHAERNLEKAVLKVTESLPGNIPHHPPTQIEIIIGLQTTVTGALHRDTEENMLVRNGGYTVLVGCTDIDHSKQTGSVVIYGGSQSLNPRLGSAFYLEKLIKETRMHVLQGTAGSAVVFDSNNLHQSNPNVGSDPRVAVGWRVVSEKRLYKSKPRCQVHIT